MIKSKSEMPANPMEIDLTGPKGNAFWLLGCAKGMAIDLGWDAKAIRDEMTAGDYEHLVETFDRHFGDFVILYR